EDAAQHAAHVGVEHRHVALVGEREDRAGGVAADSRHGSKRGVLVGQPAAVPGDRFPRDRVKPHRADVVAERIPEPFDLGAGRDRAAFLHAMLSNDVKSLAAGQGCAASLLDVHGKIQTFLWVLALEDRVLLLTPPGRAQSTIDALDAYLFSEKAYFRDATGEF